MFVPEKLKLNKFQIVRIPSPKEYFSRVGNQPIGTNNMYTGDDPAIMNQRKVDSIIDMEEFDRMRSNE